MWLLDHNGRFDLPQCHLTILVDCKTNQLIMLNHQSKTCFKGQPKDWKAPQKNQLGTLYLPVNFAEMPLTKTEKTIFLKVPAHLDVFDSGFKPTSARDSKTDRTTINVLNVMRSGVVCHTKCIVMLADSLFNLPPGKTSDFPMQFHYWNRKGDDHTALETKTLKALHIQNDIFSVPRTYKTVDSVNEIYRNKATDETLRDMLDSLR